ncbi:hypothetical protein EAF04_000347 [Stromatinia cepivora]|nr:hypothetical protein EAF04_000347 [Stromatinia cepivora]
MIIIEIPIFDLKLLINYNSRYRYYYFIYPFDFLISITNEKLNYFEYNFEIIFIISLKNTIEKHSLSPFQIITSRPIKKIDLLYLIIITSIFKYNSLSTSLDINRIVFYQISPNTEYFCNNGYIKKKDRNI